MLRIRLLATWMVVAYSIVYIAAVVAADAEPVYSHGVVAADHPLASEAGVEMLKRGGNVVDAAAATSFALSVLRPASSGIGGGGFMVIWNAETQTAVALDYRERAPAAASPMMYADADVPEDQRDLLSQRGALAVAVPGHVAGLAYAVKEYGRLDLKTVLEPAIRLARDGVVPDVHERELQLRMLKSFDERPELRKKYASLFRLYLNDGKPWGAGDRFHSPQLKALERIARLGPDGFYQRDVAAALVAESRRGGGLLTSDDLANTRPVVRTPLRVSWDGLQLVTMPPPSSGGVALLESLNILRAWEEKNSPLGGEATAWNTPPYLHVLTEAMKHAFADRAEFLGDADFADVPVKRLIDPVYGKRLSARIDAAKTFPPEYYGRFQPVEDGGTSHFSIIDATGNAVACTDTINTGFGSWVVEPEFGILLNNQMDDFAARPGKPNAFGLIQSAANSVEAGKKPLSSMTPTIAVRDGKAVLAVGASGGPRIISTTLQVLLNMTRFHKLPRQAVDAPRIHHQWLPDELAVEPPLFKGVQAPLAQHGHTVISRDNLAVSQAVLRSEQGLYGASDPRKHGRAAGY